MDNDNFFKFLTTVITSFIVISMTTMLWIEYVALPTMDGFNMVIDFIHDDHDIMNEVILVDVNQTAKLFVEELAKTDPDTLEDPEQYYLDLRDNYTNPFFEKTYSLLMYQFSWIFSLFFTAWCFIYTPFWVWKGVLKKINFWYFPKMTKKG